MDSTIAKRELRKQVLAARDELSVRERTRKNLMICHLLLEELRSDTQEAAEGAEPALPFEGKVIAVYDAMRSEVSLRSFIKAAYSLGARICFPCMMKVPPPSSNGDSCLKTQMVFREVSQIQYIDHAMPFTKNPLASFSYDDPLLEEYLLVDTEDITTVIVPLVAFDAGFNRLGYGGGNYDRFLPATQSETTIIGVAFAEQEVECVPTEAHDQPLPLIISV